MNTHLFYDPIRRSTSGRVTLVGAGPGDPELLTIKASNAIKRATVLLVDDLVNPEILAHASPRARIVQVGKRGGCVSTPQSFIEKLMILAAQNGEEVVRLKGGDPFIFGRGGEEATHLRDAGINVEIVNGITSGLAASTVLSVPLTHRDHAHGVVFMTGHNRPGESATDWAALGTAVDACRLTLVIYMGLAGISDIQAGLRQTLPAETPAAVIQHATLPQQQAVICTLATLEQRIRDHELCSPAIIVIGNVIAGAQAISQHRNFNPTSTAAIAA
jgi:uroporphyrin-III C-methyltransferase